MSNNAACAYHVDYTGYYGYEFHTAEGIVWFSGATWARDSDEHIVLETPHSETRFYAERRTSVGNYADCGTFTGI